MVYFMQHRTKLVRCCLKPVNMQGGVVMESYIAGLSMQMAMSNMQSALSVGMLKKTMDSAEESMEIMTEMLDANMPSPDGRGPVLDVRA